MAFLSRGGSTAAPPAVMETAAMPAGFNSPVPSNMAAGNEANHTAPVSPQRDKRLLRMYKAVRHVAVIVLVRTMQTADYLACARAEAHHRPEPVQSWLPLRVFVRSQVASGHQLQPHVVRPLHAAALQVVLPTLDQTCGSSPRPVLRSRESRSGQGSHCGTRTERNRGNRA